MDKQFPLIIRAGMALFGPQWQRELARMLEVNERTAQRWAAGETEPAAGVFNDIADRAEHRSRQLAQIAGECRAEAKTREG